MLVRASVFFPEGTSLCSQLQKLDKEEDAVLKKYKTKRREAGAPAIVSVGAWVVLTPEVLAVAGISVVGAAVQAWWIGGSAASIIGGARGSILSIVSPFFFNPNKYLFEKDLVRVAKKISSISIVLQNVGINDGERSQIEEAQQLFSDKLELMKERFGRENKITREELEKRLPTLSDVSGDHLGSQEELIVVHNPLVRRRGARQYSRL